jgi:hypothetical protein
MDKLQPIIQHRFWILAGLMLPLALYGYYSANASLKGATEVRETKLDEVKGGISQGFEPNDDYTTKLSKINDFLETSVDQEIVKLWNHQKQRMSWPSAVADGIPEEFMGEIGLETRIDYKNHYPFIVRNLRYRVQPVMPVQDAELATWKQKVVLKAALPQARFGDLAPTSKQVWDAQIDVWLVDLLFDAVRRINEDKDTVANAVLRQIDELRLFGGTGQPVLSGSGAGAGGGGAEDFEMDGMDAEMYDGGGAGGRRGGVTSSVAFNPAQEFGPSTESTGGGGGGMEDADAEGSMGGMGGGRNVPRIRYIAEADDAPYLERGFYMSVIINQTKIPDFLVELTNSDWPVRIVRFHVGKNPYRKEQPARRTGGGRGDYAGIDEFDADDRGAGYDMEMDDGPMGRGSGLGGGYGRQGSGVGRLGQNLPREAQDAVASHPDLVQLDLCGVITIYKQPLEIMEKLAAAGEAAEAAAQEQPSEPTAEGEDLPTLDPGPIPDDADAAKELLDPVESEPPASGDSPESADEEQPAPETDEN